MFRRQVRALIERQCEQLRADTDELGKLLAQCDPGGGAVEGVDLSSARRTCRGVRERAGAMGLDETEGRALALDAALGALARCERIEPWHMVEAMALQGDLAAAVDELEPERADLYTNCTAPAALEVAPMPGQSFG